MRDSSYPSERYSVQRAVLCVGSAVAFGAMSLLSDGSSRGPAATEASAGPAYLPGDSSGVIRMALIVGVVLMILVHLWLLRRRTPAAQTLPVRVTRESVEIGPVRRQ